MCTVESSCFFFSSRRRHTRWTGDWSSDVCSSDLAACLLITTDPDLGSQIGPELARQVATARHRQRIEAALAGQAACVLVDDLGTALTVADAWAPEHLEIQAEGASELARRVRNAGAIFVGPYAPVSLGDYLAGSNHVLPKIGR